MVPRPGLVFARRDTGVNGALLWVLMVTNAERSFWTGDVLIPNALDLGLVIPSKVRTAKIATAEENSAVAIGRLDATTWRMVLRWVALPSTLDDQASTTY